MSSISDLRAAIQGRARQRGRVIEVVGGTAKIALATGVGLFPASGVRVRAGDEVVIVNGRVLPKATPPGTVYDL